MPGYRELGDAAGLTDTGDMLADCARGWRCRDCVRETWWIRGSATPPPRCLEPGPEPEPLIYGTAISTVLRHDTAGDGLLLQP